MKKVYEAPSFDVTVYEIDDVITLSIGDGNIEGGDTGWWG